MTPSKTFTKPSGTSSEKYKNVSLQIVDNVYVGGICIELKVGDMVEHRTITNTDMDVFDYTVRSMLNRQLRIIAAEVGEQHSILKEKLCTS